MQSDCDNIEIESNDPVRLVDPRRSMTWTGKWREIPRSCVLISRPARAQRHTTGHPDGRDRRPGRPN